MAKLRLSYPAFRLPPVTSGSGSLKTLADHPGISEAAFLLSGQSSVVSLVAEALARGGLARPLARTLQKPAGEPTRESIEQGAEFLRSIRPPTIVAVGGGSVLDWARLAWARGVGALDLDRGVMTHAGAAQRPTFVLVPTTCASGAESATVAVYADGGVKRPVLSPSFLADRVVLDGHFLKSLDDGAYAASVADALSHALESLLSIVPNGLAKMVAGGALRTLLEHGPGGVPTASRADRLLESSYLAGGAASHTSVGIAHAFAHAMAREGLAHGRGNATAIVPALRFNEAAPSMALVLQHAACGHTELLQRVRSIVAPARTASAPLVQAVLVEPHRRRTLVEGMLADTALRSNPVPADGPAVDGFLTLVSEELCR